ncbi:Transforming growth factor beta-1-induced transcript 1 protein, partial [Borealophlyctis nickersoniae]
FAALLIPSSSHHSDVFEDDEDDRGRGRSGASEGRSRSRPREGGQRGAPTRPPRDRSRPRDPRGGGSGDSFAVSRTGSGDGYSRTNSGDERAQRPARSKSRPRDGPDRRPGLNGNGRTWSGDSDSGGGNSPRPELGEKKAKIDDIMADLMNEMHMDDGRGHHHGHDYGHDHDSQTDSVGGTGLICGGCDNEIRDISMAFEITALAKYFHANCFRCRICDSTFSENNPYIPQNGQAICERCYEDALQRICAKCQRPIFSRPVYALGKVFHERHLRCRHCRDPIRGNPVEHNGSVYCERDYAALIAPKCRECRHPIQGETIYALDAAWHKDCFICAMCRIPFPDKTFYVFGNDPLCRRHFHQRNNSLCGTCDHPIEGPCAEVLELNKRYHPECWCCIVCNMPLTTTYYSYGNQAYCEEDIQR